jgi:drug/metabolite transporter (DMT)-like permease
MTHEELTIKKDRMRFTKDKASANLVILSIVFDCLYFVSIYQSDVGSYYYTWVIGASIIYNLLFLLTAFLASEGVKNRKTGYTGLLIGIGLMQIVRIFYLPAKAHAATVVVSGAELPAMADGQYFYVVACLAVSAVCCIVAAVMSHINNKNLAEHMKTIENAA